MNIALIDNYDSFTYNLKELLELSSESQNKVQVIRSRRSLQEVEDISPEAIVISPGPGRPNRHSLSFKAIERYHRTLPILGVCLGMQYLNEFFDGKTVYAAEPVHGKTSEIQHNGIGVFEGVKQDLVVARYHSLAIQPADDFVVTAQNNSTPMAIQHHTLPLYGVQFHPESFLSESGRDLIANFYKRILPTVSRRQDASL